MEKSKENVPLEEVLTAAPVDTPSAGYPPHPGYPHGGPQTGYPAQPAGMAILPLAVGPDSCTVVCPSCHQTVQTDVKVVPTSRTHLFALLLALFGCWLCCCIPYCVDGLKAKHHHCPNCKAFIAAYDR